MPKVKGTGHKKFGGRKKNTPNVSTRTVREMIAHIAETNAPRLEQWLLEVAAESPKNAVDLYLRMIEYHIPKVTRMEMVGDANNPIQHAVTYTIAKKPLESLPETTIIHDANFTDRSTD